MKAIEFGQNHEKIIVLLHGGGLSWWNYRNVAAVLEKEYHVVLPVLDGHADSDEPYTTIEENAARIIRFIDENFHGQVLAIGGLSLGGQTAVEMLSQRPDICRYALIESAMVKPMKLTHALIGPAFSMSYGLIRQKWFARMQFSYLRIDPELFNDYYRDTCRIQKADMIAFLKANSAYALKPGLSKTGAKVKIVAGSREQKGILESAEQLHKAIPSSEVHVLDGMYHGDLSINNPQRYAQMLRQLCEEEDQHAL